MRWACSDAQRSAKEQGGHWLPCFVLAQGIANVRQNKTPANISRR